jgi:hypothetical protein
MVVIKPAAKADESGGSSFFQSAETSEDSFQRFSICLASQSDNHLAVGSVTAVLAAAISGEYLTGLMVIVMAECISGNLLRNLFFDKGTFDDPVNCDGFSQRCLPPINTIVLNITNIEADRVKKMLYQC